MGQQQYLHQGLGSAHSSNCAQHVTGSLCPQQVEPIPTEDVLLESYLHTSNMHCSVHQASVQTSNTLQIVEPDEHKESNSLRTSVQKVSSAVPESECGETLSSLNLKSECQPQTSNSNKHQAQPRFQQAQPTQSALDGEKATSASAPVEPQSEVQTTNKQQEQTSTETQTQTQWTQTTNEGEDGYAELSPADEKVMEELQREMELRDGRYYVKIPFYSNVEEVPENFQDAMTMVDRVYRSLKQRNLADKYSEVFQQQLHDGIIEEVDLSESKKRVFIPHHPVIKMNEQTTTKIRPVFNCSYKKGDKPSLNDACFPGLNLHTNMVELLHRFRTNKYILTADIERAFLQIYLKDDKDKDRFSFLWRTEDGVKAYRYRTILFGLNASPFILNHVLQLHIQQYPETETTSALKRSLYVDNFLSTTSQLDSLKNIYHESMEILREGGFNLRSWKSNHPVMLEMMEEESTMHKHSAPKEKTLGYLYSIKDDTMSLGEFELDDSQHLTKRQLLSNISKVFDPLCLTLPVTIKGRLLMKQVWQEGTDWDEEVSPEVQAQWEKLKPDFLALTSLSFPRQTINMETSEPVTLHVFCDGSKSCYGVACYLQQEDKVSLVY